MEHIFIGRSTGKFPTVTGKTEKVILFFWTECCKRKFVFTASRPFFIKCKNWFVQMVNEILERNLPVLNFAAYHLPRTWAERFVACAAGGIVWLKFWRRSHDPKKGAGTRRYFSSRGFAARGGQISLDWYSGSAAKSHSTSTKYRQLHRLSVLPM